MILATHIRPFDAKQVVYVLSDDYDIEESQLCDLSQLTETIMGFVSSPSYNIKKIEFHGPKQFCIKEKSNIEKTADFYKYCANSIEILVKSTD